MSGVNNIITRASWGAEEATARSNLVQNPPNLVVVHHSDTPSCTSQNACKTRILSIQSHHMHTNKWSDIGYNFLIGSEGSIFEGRGWGITGAHAIGVNDHSIGICLIGKFQDNEPSEAQLRSLKSLIAGGIRIGKIHANYQLIGHRQAANTKCPGDKLYNIIRTMPNFDSRPIKT